MKSLVYVGISVSIIVVILFLLPTPQTSTETTDEHIQNSFRFVNVDYFDGEIWHNNAELIIENGRVVTSTTEELITLDMKGKYVLPGLIDAHTHAFNDALQQALNFGVTTELDMFTDVRFMQQHQSKRDELNHITQADLFSAGTLVTSEKGHGTQFGMSIPTLNNAQDAVSFVNDRINEGSDYIKVVYHHDNNHGPYKSIDKASLVATINAAKQANKKVVVHVSDLASAKDAIKAGAHGLVHTFGDEIVTQDVLDEMLSKGTFIIPTLSVIASFSKSNHSQILAESDLLAPRINQSIKSQLSATFDVGDHMSDQLSIAIENTRLMHQAGIPILAGSDAPNPGTSHGISMHGELILLVQSGLTINEALQAATSTINRHFDIGERGHLRPGARADILVLNKDPRLSIQNTQAIDSIYKNGFKHIPSQVTLENTQLQSGVLSHFEEASLSTLNGQTFIETSDKMRQGKSTANIEWITEGCNDAGALLVKGDIDASFFSPWAGTFLPMSEQFDKGTDLSAFTKLTFNTRGDAGVYQLMVFMPMVQQPQMLNFTVRDVCSTVTIKFSDYPQINWQDISGLAWVAGRDKDQFAFALDNIVME